MSMTCFIKEENDITELKQYSAVKKISELSNRFTKTGVDHGYNSPEIEMSYGVRTYEMDVLKVSRSKSVGVFLFFYHYLKKKDLFLFTHLIKTFLIMELHLKTKISKLM